MLKKGTIYLLSVGLMQTCVMPAFAEVVLNKEKQK